MNRINNTDGCAARRVRLTNRLAKKEGQWLLPGGGGGSAHVVAASAGSVFYQLYLLGGRAAGEAALARAAAVGVKGLFVTIDTPVAGMRERDFRNGLTALMGRDRFGRLWLTRTATSETQASCLAADPAPAAYPT